MGAGKSTVLAEASDLLASRRISHAAIDLDALGLSYLPSPADNGQVMYRNLQSVRENYVSHGVQRFLLARAIEDCAELELCRRVVSATSTVVCRLTASLETMQKRIKLRETGLSQQQYVDRVAILNDILDLARLEDFTVTNENRSVTEAATEMLVKAKWISV